jgi:hypothetical protein
MNPKDYYDRTENIILRRFFDNFQDNEFCLYTFHQHPQSQILDNDLTFLRRPIILQIGYLLDLGEPSEDEDEDSF